VPIASGSTIDMMAKYKLKPMVVLNGEKILDDVIRAYQAACAKQGRERQLGQDVVRGAGVYLANGQEEAIREIEPAHEQAQSLPFHRVIAANRSFLRHAQNFPPCPSPIRKERRSVLFRADRESGVVIGDEGVPKPGVGSLKRGDSG
jgi:hypothetical protein